MRYRPAVLTAALCLVVLACFNAAASSADQGLSKRTHDLFAWFDQLGFEDLSRAKFVLIYTGNTYIDRRGAPRPDVCEGFLVAGDGPTFRVINLDLAPATYIKVGEGPAVSPFCGYRAVSIEDHARELLRQMRKPNYLEQWRQEGIFRGNERLSRSGQIFVLARECARRGLAALAEEVVDALARHPARDGADPSPPRDYSDRLQDDLATAMAGRAFADLHDGANTWKAVADRFRRIVEFCPGSGQVGTAQEMLAKANRLVAEEAAHTRVGSKSLDDLPIAEKARELVWGLRDEQNPEDSMMVMFGERRERIGGRGMDKLRVLGLDAVPALLAELRDQERLSRVSATPGDNGAIGSITLTQELAESVLEDISSLPFFVLATGEKPEDRWPKVSEVVEAWAQAVRVGEEEAWMAEIVRRGGVRAAACAGPMHEKYPAAFVEAGCAGFAASKENHDFEVRRELLELLARHREPRVEAFLVAELESSSEIEERVAIAHVLRAWGRADADQEIKGQWQKAVSRGLAPIETLRTAYRSPHLDMLLAWLSRSQARLPDGMIAPAARDDVEMLQTLAGSDSPDSLRAILASWSLLSAEYRRIVVEFATKGPGNGVFDEAVLASPTHRAFCQELLLGALEDVTELSDWKIDAKDGWVPFPRLCDLAGGALHDRWPAKFAFDRLASESVRERQRIVILNGQRRDAGLPELPLPPARAKVIPAKRNDVVAVEWDEESAKPDATLAAQFAAWKDRSLQIDAVNSAIFAYAKKPQADTNRLRVSVHRDDDSTGLVVRVRLTPGKPKGGTTCSIRQMVAMDRELRVDMEFTGELFLALDRQRWADFKRGAHDALSLPADKPFALRAEASLVE